MVIVSSELPAVREPEAEVLLVVEVPVAEEPPAEPVAADPPAAVAPVEESAHKGESTRRHRIIVRGRNNR
jgi:hypothetical protein